MANLLAREAFELGLVPKLLSFADPLKREADRRGYDKESNPLEYREFCQEFGAMRREEDSSYWVDSFEKNLKCILEEEKLELNKSNPYWERCIIVDDCRYHNEVGLGIKYHATMIFTTVGDRELPEAEAEWRTHHSESMVNEITEGDKEQSEWFDYHLLNDGDIKALGVKARVMAPIWCGVAASGISTNLEDSIKCDPEELEDMLSELLDVLLKEFEDEEEDPPVSDDGSD